MSTIDIDRDAAHEAAQHELGKPIYPKASLTERLMDWIDELLYKLADASSSVPGGWLTLSVLLILLAIAIVVAVRIARRTMRTNRGGTYSLFGEHELSAALRMGCDGIYSDWVDRMVAASKAESQARRAGQT